MQGATIGDRRGDTRSLDYSSYIYMYIYIYNIHIYIYIARPPPPPRSIWEAFSPPDFSNPGNSSFGGGIASHKFLLKSN